MSAVAAFPETIRPTRSFTARRIASAIQDLIRRDRVGPGGRLPTEHALARQFRVSRPIVREAIQTLKALGIVESRPRVGLRVLPFDPTPLFDQLVPRIEADRDRADLYEFRRMIELSVLPLVLERASKGELELLEEMLRAPLPEGKNAFHEGMLRDLGFHEGLWRLARNRFVWSLRGLLLRFFHDIESRRPPRNPSALLRKTNAEHLAVVRALQRGDLDRAIRMMSRNLGTFRPGTE